MHKSVQITLIIVSAVLILGIISVSTFYSLASGDNTITSNGQASIDVMPDLVTIHFNIQTIEDTLQKARDKNSEISDDLITNLLKKGFERKDIQTEYYSINENYVWNEDGRKQEGYIASHSIKVEFSAEDSEKIGEVIDAGINANASLSYINFELSMDKQNKYKAEAIKSASQDARIKAEALAQGLNLKIGDLVSVSNNDFYYSPWRAYDNALSSTALEKVGGGSFVESQISPSEREISASVTAQFEIK